MRINDEGIMCIQHQVESNKGYETYIDFLMVPEATYDHETREDEREERREEKEQGESERKGRE